MARIVEANLSLSGPTAYGLVALLAFGEAAAFVALTKRSLQQFTKWLTAEDELPADPMAGMQAPKVVRPSTATSASAAATSVRGMRRCGWVTAGR